ncbi:MAG: hypothetical protein WCO44_07670 [Bacteroidota bacterium]
MNTDFTGYPLYPSSEDIYNKLREERDVNPEDIAKAKDPDETDNAVFPYDSSINTGFPGSELDVPGSDLDDLMEEVGEEDEENNFYSLANSEQGETDDDNSM